MEHMNNICVTSDDPGVEKRIPMDRSLRFATGDREDKDSPEPRDRADGRGLGPCPVFREATSGEMLGGHV